MKQIDSLIWNHIKKRILAITVALAILLTYVFYNAINVFFINGEKYQQIATNQYKTSLQINKKRGTIYDSNNKPLAISVPTESIFVHPHLLTERDKALKILSRELKIPYNELFRKIFEKKRYFIYLKRQLDREFTKKLLQELKDNGVSGVGTEAEIKRFYPNNELAAQIVGFTGVDAQGLSGIEKYYNDILQFKGEMIAARKDAKRNIFDFSIDEFDNINEQYHDVVLTIDSFIQYATEESLKKGVIKTGSKRGIAIVMNPSSGEVLAMAQYPTFDLNSFKTAPKQLWKSAGVSFVYEPGSTMKVMTIASAINENIVKPSDEFDCENGRTKLGRFIIRDSKPHKILNVSDIMKVSSNIGTLKIILQMAKDDFYKYIKGFGFGKKYDIPIPGQEIGLVQPLKRWKKVEISNISFGQGIGVTPLQLITAFSSVINGGKLIKPLLVKEIRKHDKIEVVQKFEPEILESIITKKSSETIKEMLEKVVSKEGTAPQAAIPGVRVGGKTGTAQKVDPTQKGYSDKRIASFIGFFPYEKPLYSILVIMDEPMISTYGGVVAAPVFKEIAIKLLKYNHMLPKENLLTEEEPLFLLDLKKTFSIVEEAVKSEATEEELLNGENIDSTMPNLIGLDLRSALSQVDNGREIDLVGSGEVYKTIPVAGEKIDSNQKIQIYLKNQF